MRYGKWLLAAFVAWWVIHDPSSAGLEVHNLAGFATHAASSLATALSSI